MKRLWLPLLCDKETFQSNNRGGSFIPGVEVYKAYASKEEALTAAKELAMTNPQGKVVIFMAEAVIEPRRIEFAEKRYTDAGELVV